MEHVSTYRKIIRVIKGGAKRLETANTLIDAAAIEVDRRRERVRNQLRYIRLTANLRG